MNTYDDTFFEYVNAGATRSAKKILPNLLDQLQVSSVLDVGCGQGAWLAVWMDLGVTDVQGIDGSYVDRSRLLIPPGRFAAEDLGEGFDLGRSFDLVQSLEVAEHLPAAVAGDFVASLTRHGGLILFSAAPKGQGGDHHVNEQDYNYWKKLFEDNGYVAVDWLRPLIADDKEIEPWYRYNTVLYAKRQVLSRLPESLRQGMLPVGQPIPDISPPFYKIRKALLRLLPVPVMTRLAKMKAPRLAANLKVAR